MRIRFAAMWLLCILGVLASCGGTRVVAESRDGWELLGRRTVQGKHDVDVIEVGRDEGLFHRIQIEVRGSALEMYDITVTFGDGEKFSPDTRLVFGKGEHSRIIDLPGAARVIRSVRFHYGNLPRGGRARVQLWAK
jgi:hypothetical protein